MNGTVRDEKEELEGKDYSFEESGSYKNTSSENDNKKKFEDTYLSNPPKEKRILSLEELRKIIAEK